MLNQQLKELLTESLVEVSEEITTTGSIDFLFKHIKVEFIIERLAVKLLDDKKSEIQQLFY